MEEIWRDIDGYDGKYQVSNLGNVRSFCYKTPRERKPSFNGHGYLRVDFRLAHQRKMHYVHRLVAEAFIPNPEDKPQVNHINGIKTDNRVENLEWVTHIENGRHASKTGLVAQGENAYNAGLTSEQVVYIRDNPDGLTIRALATKFCVCADTISQVQRGTKYRNAGGTIRGKMDRRVPDDVRKEIRKLYIRRSRNFGTYGLAKRFGIAQSTVRYIIKEVAE